MAVLYVRSTDGSDADNGTTWALAKATVAGALAIAAAGDTIYVSQVHAETQASAMTWTSPGTPANPVKILCANDGAAPPTALATTGTITTTGAFSINTVGSVYVYGLTFNIGTGSTSASFLALSTQAAEQRQVYESCNFRLVNTGTSTARLQFRSNTSPSVPASFLLIDCTMKFAATGQGLSPSRCQFEWRGGSVDAAGSAPTSLCIDSAADIGLTQRVRFLGLDLSHLGSGKTLVDGSGGSAFTFSFEDCKLGASVAVAINLLAGQEVQLHNCDSADTNYRYAKHTAGGSIVSETTVVRTGGASNGTTGYSYRSTATGSVHFLFPLELPAFPKWNETTGSAITVAVSVLCSAWAGLHNDDKVWLRVQYLGTAGFPKASFADDAKADVLATGVAQETDTGSAWDSGVTARANSTAYTQQDLRKVASNPGRVFECTTAGTTAGSEPGGYATAADGDAVADGAATFTAMQRRKVSVAVTPQEKGPVIATVCVGVAAGGGWLFVDPLVQVS